MNIAACVVVSVWMVVSAVVATPVNRVVGGFVVPCVVATSVVVYCVVATSVVVYCVVGASVVVYGVVGGSVVVYCVVGGSWVVGITSTKAEP